MSELSSNRKIEIKVPNTLKVQSFDINSERSNNENNNYLIINKELSNTINNNLTNSKFNDNIEKINATMNQKNIRILKNLISSSYKEDIKSKTSSKRNTFILPNFNNDNEIIHVRKDEKKEMNKKCLLCDNELTQKELTNNFLECFHGFCDSCYYDYLKEKISNNDIYKLKCLEYGCDIVLFDDFIQNHIVNDIPLLEKYLKYKKRLQLSMDPNIQLCPFPDCESYASKNKNNNFYVQCLNGHKFCFNCLKDWHDEEKCKIEKDRKFEKWKNSKNIKRCPKCQYFVEKNEGCNHMNCINCKYEWCWLCLKESLPGHFDEGGNCNGLQFTEYQCFSNRGCVFLYHLLLQILGILELIFFSPFYFCKFVFQFIREINYDVNAFFIFFITFYFCLTKFIYSLYVVFFISIIMLFYWPLKIKINEFIEEHM